MNATDKTAVFKLVLSHFSKATDADASMVWDAVKGYSLADAEYGLSEHHREKGANAWRPDVNRVKNIAFNQWKARQRDRPEIRAVDAIRRMDPLNFSPDVGDKTVVLNHYSGCWRQMRDGDYSPEGRMAARVYIMAHCRGALKECGLSEADANELARGIVDLEDGESVLRVKVFNEVPVAAVA